MAHTNKNKTTRPSRISMPSYPFERNRCWITQTKEVNNTSEQKQDTYYYQCLWEETKIDTGVASSISNTVLLLSDNTGLKDALQKQIDRDIISVTLGQRFRKSQSPYNYTINIDSPYDYMSLFGELKNKNLVPEAIVIDWSFDKLQQQDIQNIQVIYFIISALLKYPINVSKIIFFYNQQSGQINPFIESAAGYTKSISPIWPRLVFKIVQNIIKDKNSSDNRDAAQKIIYELGSEDNGLTNEINYKDGSRYVRKSHSLMLDKVNETFPIKEDGVYLITGGAGGLGFIFSRYLIEKHRAKLVLTGRSPMNEKIQAKLDSLGGNVKYIQADTADKKQMQKVWEKAKAEFGQINGIFHIAGISTGLPVNQKTREVFETTLQPKIQGTIILDEVTKDDPLDFFILFSSTSSILGDFGQCDYAVANRFLDSYGQHREELRKAQKRHGRTVVINWPLWKDGGIHLSEQVEALYLKTSGLSYIEIDDGIKIFEDIISSTGENEQVIVLKGDKDRIEQSLQMRKIPQKQIPASQQKTVTKKTSTVVKDGTSPLAHDLREVASETARIPAESIDINENLGSFGFDSITLSEFSTNINAKYNITLTAVAFFENSTIQELSDYLEREFKTEINNYYKTESPDIMQDEQPSQTSQVIEDTQVESVISVEPVYKMDRDIAIIGAHGMFPKSGNLDELWTNLETMSDMIMEIPTERWNWRDYYSADPIKEKGTTNIKHGGFISGPYEFDPLFFKISPQEALMMDPQQRKFTEVVWRAIEDAGYKPSSLSGKLVGVFVGVQYNEYQDAIKSHNDINNYTATGNVQSIIANRISYILNIHGPSISIDTACSSSLIAIHQAVRAINNNECELSIAGGVSLILSPQTTITLSQLGVLSPDGRCKTFDKSANGYVRSEGTGALILKPFKQAVKDNDNIYGIIKGTAISHGGRASSLTAPNSRAQAALLVKAYKESNIDPSTITYIETHGTGTELGDPVEIEGIKMAFNELERVFDKKIDKKGYCGIGSVKSNMGHLEPAAGIAGIAKVLLSMKNKKLPGNPQLNALNPLINVKNTPLYIVDKTKNWDRLKDTESGKPVPRRSGISSFGFGGAYAHIILEEYEEPANTLDIDHSNQIFVLSARNDEQLKTYAINILDYIDTKLLAKKTGINTHVLEDVAKEVCQILEIDDTDIRTDEGLGEYGFEPLLLSELKNRLEQNYLKIDTDLTLSTTVEDIAKELSKAENVQLKHTGAILQNMVYTLQVGRDELNERLAIVVSNIDGLKSALKGFIAGNANVKNLHRGSLSKDNSSTDLLIEGEEGREFIDAVIRNRSFNKLAALWVTGLSLDWELLYPQAKPKRISLPGYPFAKDIYRITKKEIPVPLHKPLSAQTLYYQGMWEKTDFTVNNTSALSNNILLFGSSKEEQIVKVIKENFSKDQVIFIEFGSKYEKNSDTHYVIDQTDAKSYNILIQDLIAKKTILEHIVYINIAPSNNIEDGLNLLYSLYFLTQALMAQKQGLMCLLYIFSEPDNELQTIHRAMCGMFRTIEVENPNYLYKTIVASEFKNISEIILTEFKTIDGVEVHYESNERYVNRWHGVEANSRGQGVDFKEKGVYLITGGMGAIGLNIAKYIANEVENPTIVLTGRSELGNNGLSKLDEIKGLGAEVEYLRTDISKRNDVKRLVNEINDKYNKINGIIHSAGVIKDAYLQNKTREQIEQVIAPKVFGTVYLDEETRNRNLDFFILFSSASAIIGNQGQSDYSYANRFMDYYAQKMTNDVQNRKTLSISWPFWEHGGMDMPDNVREFLKTNLGMEPMPTQIGMDAMRTALVQLTTSHCMVLYGNQERLEQSIERLNYTFLEEGAEDIQETDVLDQPVKENIESLVKNDLKKITAETLAISINDISTQENMGLYGFDSMSYNEYAQKLSKTYNLEITPVMFYENSSIDKLTVFMLKEFEPVMKLYYNKPVEKKAKSEKPKNVKVLKRQEPLMVQVPSKKETSRQDQEDIAIIGVSGVFPGSKDLDEFWTHLESGTDLISEVPRERWDWREHFGNPLKEKDKTNAKWGGFISDVDKFDPAFFNISHEEACMMDPQQRILMEVVWQTIEDAGYNASKLWGKPVGVFIGASFSDYQKLVSKHMKDANAFLGTGIADTMIANRISFFLNIHGPSESIDTACSSSLIAIHRAVQSIRMKESEMAIAGGVSIMLTPEITIGINQLGVLSPDGRCKTFDKSANGYVRGEGIGTILLKPLSKAIKDNDNIQGIIKSTVVNHGGRASSLTAPNPEAQTALLVKAYEQGQVSPDTLSYIETHGTGTALGDPVEIEGIKKAFLNIQKKTTKTNYCGLGAVKTNIGHLEPAAGIAGVTKVLLAMKHRKLPATIHLKTLNPYIRLKNTPFYIVEKTQPWDRLTDGHNRPIPRRAGVSSFGFGGANAHVVIEEYEESGRDLNDREQIIVLSAKSGQQLKQYALNLINWLKRNNNEQLEDIAYTLQVGRQEMEYRLAIVVSSTGELNDKLIGFCNGDNNINGLYRGSLENERDNKYALLLKGNAGEAYISVSIESKDLDKLGQLWVLGVEVDWKLLHQTQKTLPKRISLPTYPFARQRCWIEETVVKKSQPVLKPELKPLKKLEQLSKKQHKESANNLIDEFKKVEVVAETKTIEKPGLRFLKELEELSHEQRKESANNLIIEFKTLDAVTETKVKERSRLRPLRILEELSHEQKKESADRLIKAFKEVKDSIKTKPEKNLKLRPLKLFTLLSDDQRKISANKIIKEFNL